MKKVLIVSSDNAAHLVTDLPHIFKKGGYHVTYLAAPSWNTSSSIDLHIPAPIPAALVIEQLAHLIQNSAPYDLIILGCDLLIWALMDSQIDPAIKQQLYPIQNREHLKALDGKTGVASALKKMGLITPPSATAHSKQEAIKVAHEIGFPVMLKVSRSGAGNGVFKCEKPSEILQSPISEEDPFLVEKFITGELVSVEPLYINSKLLAYSYSKLTYCPEPFQPSLERLFTPCPAIEPTLFKLGEEFQMNCFANLTFIYEPKSKQHYLFEVDFRPNRWVRYGKYVGVNWSKALRGPSPLQKPLKTKQMRHFPAAFQHAIQLKDLSRILPWFYNQNGCWRTIPFYDLNFLFSGFRHFIKKKILK